MDGEPDIRQGVEDEDSQAVDGGAASHPQKRRQCKRQCALCQQVVKMLTGEQIRRWVGDGITLQTYKCSGKGTGQAGVSHCKHFQRISVFTDGSKRSQRKRNNALSNIRALTGGTECPYAASS